MPRTAMSPRIIELLLQSLEHEKGGVLVYEAALKNVLNEELREEWAHFLDETRHHVEVLSGLCTALGIDAGQATPGVKVVRHLGKALVAAIDMAREAGDPAAAEIVACECVVHAETKDHLDWQLIGKCAEQALQGESAQLLKEAYDEIEDQEDEHVYHAKGWCRELWIASLGMEPVLPPPEETRNVKSAMGQARAEQTRR